MTLRRARIVALLLMLMIAVFALPGGQAGAQIETTIRVLLKRLKVEDALRIDVQGTYMLEGGSMVFGDGAAMTVVLRGDQLVLHSDAMAVVMGNSMKLIRCEG